LRQNFNPRQFDRINSNLTISTLQRRNFLKLAGLFGLSATTIFGCQRLNFVNDLKQTNPIVRIGYLPITDAAALLAAHDKGFLNAEGLEVSPPIHYHSWDEITQAFIAREVNVIHLLMPTTMWVRYGMQFPGKVVAWNHTNGSALTVLPEINELTDLAGRTIAIPSWFSIHNILLQMLLRKAGLEPVIKLKPTDKLPGDRQVFLEKMSPLDMISKLKSGQIAGYIVAEPFNAVRERLNVGKILRLTGGVWQDHACCVVFMHEDDLKQRPDWVQAVVTAIVKAQQWSRNNRRELAHLLSNDGSQYTPFSFDVLSRVLTNYDADFYYRQGAIHHPEWRSPRIDFQPFPFPSYTQALAGELQRTLIPQNLTKTPIHVPNRAPNQSSLNERSNSSNVDDPLGFFQSLSVNQIAHDLVDDSFVRRALQIVGGSQAFNLPVNFERQETLKV